MRIRLTEFRRKNRNRVCVIIRDSRISWPQFSATPTLIAAIQVFKLPFIETYFRAIFYQIDDGQWDYNRIFIMIIVLCIDIII